MVGLVVTVALEPVEPVRVTVSPETALPNLSFSVTVTVTPVPAVVEPVEATTLETVGSGAPWIAA